MRKRWPLVKASEPSTPVAEGRTDIFDQLISFADSLGLSTGSSEQQKDEYAKDEPTTPTRVGIWMGLPGIIEYKISKTGSIHFGDNFLKILEWLNIPSLTQVDRDRVENAHMEGIDVQAYSISIKIFGTYLTDLFPIEELRDMNDEGKAGSWLRLILYFLIWFVFVVVLLVVGKEIGMGLIQMIPGASSLLMSVKRGQDTLLWREEVRLLFGKVFEAINMFSEDVDEKHLTVMSGFIQLLSFMGKMSFV